MIKWKSFVSLSVGLKFVVAITGLIMVLFVAFHLINNVHIFWGQEVYNRDGFGWKKPGVIETARVVLLTSVLIHAAATIWITHLNRRARLNYQQPLRYARTTWSGRFMIVSGCSLAIFIIYHVLHAKAGFIHPDYHTALDPWGRKDVYNLMVHTLRHPVTGMVYFLGLTGLFAHLHHGVQSLFTSLGVPHESWGSGVRYAGVAVAAILYLGYLSVPLAVWIGWVAPA